MPLEDLFGITIALHGVSEFEHGAHTCAAAIADVEKSAGIMAGVVGIAAAAALEHLGHEALEGAENIEKLNISLERVYGTTGPAIAQQFRDIANASALPNGPLLDLGRDLSTLTHNAGLAERAMVAVNDTVSSTSMDASGIEAVSRAYKMLATEGPNATRGLRGIQIQGVPIYDILAEQLGTSARALGHPGETHFTNAQMIEALTRGLEKHYGGGGKELADSPLGQATIAQKAWNETVAETGTLLLQAIRPFAQLAAGLTHWIEIGNRASGGLLGITVGLGLAVVGLGAMNTALLAFTGQTVGQFLAGIGTMSMASIAASWEFLLSAGRFIVAGAAAIVGSLGLDALSISIAGLDVVLAPWIAVALLLGGAFALYSLGKGQMNNMEKSMKDTADNTRKMAQSSDEERRGRYGKLLSARDWYNAMNAAAASDALGRRSAFGR